MRERITAFLTSFKEWWDNAAKRTRMIILGSVAAALVLTSALILVVNHKDYVTLYNDLTNTENANVIAVLNDAGIPYKVDNGRLLVERRDEDKARLQLAVFGFDNTGFTTYDIANSAGLTSTQKDKERAELYQLQNRLQSTIELFPEVSKAVVTISLPEKTVFALQNDDKPASASITIQKKAGRTLTPEQVRGIINMVKGSVSGLTEDNISIVDERGDMKSTLQLNEDYNNRKLDLTEQVNNSLKSHILAVVRPPYGADKVEVAVFSVLNTDAKVTEQTSFQPLDPENPRNNPTDYEEYERNKTGDGFAAAGGVPGAEDNVGTPQYAQQEADAANSDYYSGHDIIDYLVGSTKDQIVKDGFVVEKATASILIDATALPEGERDQIIALASHASGIPSENITVQNIKFAQPLPIEATPTPFPTTLAFAVGIGLVAFCALLIIILMTMSRRNKARLAAQAAEEAMLDEYGMPLVELMGQESTFEPITLQETPEQKLKLQIKDLAETDPEIVAQLIKTWLISNK